MTSQPSVDFTPRMIFGNVSYGIGLDEGVERRLGVLFHLDRPDILRLAPGLRALGLIVEGIGGGANLAREASAVIARGDLAADLVAEDRAQSLARRPGAQAR